VDAIVEVEGLVKKFDGRIRALDSLTLTVARGSVYGLLGPTAPVRPRWSACWRPCCCPMRAARAGIDVLQDPAGVRARIGLAGQAAAVDELLTGRENLEMVGRLYGLPRRQARHRADDVLERIRLTDAANRRVNTYSGGMRRRLDLAASLAGRPQVLFLVIFILMFTYVFGGAIQATIPPAAAGRYVNWLIPACWPSSPCSAARAPHPASPRTSPTASSTGSGRCP
jgi:ABC-type nitrate/sulfonate/bicarbonate transport system ATPase subunit